MNNNRAKGLLSIAALIPVAEASPPRGVEILCIGTELLLGNIVNGNARWLAEQLAALEHRLWQGVVSILSSAEFRSPLLVYYESTYPNVMFQPGLLILEACASF